MIGARIPWHVDGRSLRGKPVARRVSVHTNRRGSVSASANAVAAGVLSTARRNAALFGEGTDSLYRLGPHKELLGRPVEAVASTMNGVEVRLDDAAQFEDVRTASLFSPSHVAGEIQRELACARDSDCHRCQRARCRDDEDVRVERNLLFCARARRCPPRREELRPRVYPPGRRRCEPVRSARGRADAARSPVEQQGRGSMSTASPRRQSARRRCTYRPTGGALRISPRCGHSVSASRCSRC